MKLQQAKRSSSPMKLLISGPSGSGKSFSSLQLARGLVDKWEDICIIDTENGSADLYSHLGGYSVIRLEAPFHPNRYIEALNLAVEAGMKCIIIDSISHEWSGKGGCLELHEKATNSMKIPNSFAAWASVTPLHQSFLDAIIQCPVHVVCTARAKTDFIMVDRNGKSAPQKVGMALVTRDGFDYEISIHLELDQQHQAHCSKDRTGLFMDKSPFVISADTGIRIQRWCNSSGEESLEGKISQCSSMPELIKLYDELSHPQQEQAKMLFRKRKAELLAGKKVSDEVKQIPIHKNGHAVIL
jgi:DNA polymerase III delta prime subunit